MNVAAVVPALYDQGAALAALAGVWALAVISPGPNFVVTVHQAVSYSASPHPGESWPVPRSG